MLPVLSPILSKLTPGSQTNRAVYCVEDHGFGKFKTRAPLRDFATIPEAATLTMGFESFATSHQNPLPLPKSFWKSPNRKNESVKVLHKFV